MIPLFLYAVLTVLAAPVIFIWLIIRLKKGKEERGRFGERLGFPKKKRPKGKLVWMHGASVGECLSMMPLIQEILNQDPDVHVMVTSGTVTSAELMAKRLPQRAFHQYIPVDFPWAARHFVKYWNADLVLWFESDFWPNILRAVHENKKPLVLLNGRISDKSFEKWQKAGVFIKSIQRLFTLSFGQTQQDADRLKVLGAENVVCVGNLKFAAVNAPFNSEELSEMLKQIGNRPRCVGASTHGNEEEMIAGFHLNIQKSFPDFLSIVAPRHPNRADEIETLFKAKGLTVARRTRGEKITPKVDVYLADTIGEMGLIYQLAPIVFVGGSLIPFGGQNMLEPMRLHRVVLVGVHTFNFKEIVKRATEEGALIQVATPSELLGNVVRLLRHPEEQEPMAEQAEIFALSEMAVLGRVYDVLKERVGL